MAERQGGAGFSAPPHGLGGAGPRRPAKPRPVGVLVVILVAAAIIAIGWLGPRLASRPALDAAYFATPTPGRTATARPTPTATFDARRTPAPTPLPVIAVPGGEPPSGHLAIVGGPFRILDLASGAAIDGPNIDTWRDAVFGDGTGSGWVCVCFVDEGAASDAVVELRILRIASDGTVQTIDVGAVGPRGSMEGQPDVLTDFDRFGDDTRGLLATAIQDGESWRIAVQVLDVGSGRLVGSPTPVGIAATPPSAASPVPSATPRAPGSPEEAAYLDGPYVRVGPDDRTAFVWGIVQPVVDESTPVLRAWRVDLAADGSPIRSAPADGLDGLSAYCGSAGFAAPDRFAALCVDSEFLRSNVFPFVLRTIALDGRASGELTLETPADQFVGELLFDQANGLIYAWNPIGLSLRRIDARTLHVDTVTFDPEAMRSDGITGTGGSLPPSWGEGLSTVGKAWHVQLVPSADGTRLYAIGIRPFDVTRDPATDAQGSYGVFVIDRASLALVDRWSPLANDVAIAVLSDGRVVISGEPGADAFGHAAPWGGSLAIRDPSDGRVLARYGQVSVEFPAYVVP